MKKLILCILFLVLTAFAWQSENYTGFRDTSLVADFNADSTKYSKWFRYAAYYDMHVDVLFDDTSATGYADDSVNFVWGIQTAHPILNSSGTRDTAISLQLIALDTAETGDATFTNTVVEYGTDGTYSFTKRLIDTTNVTGFARQESKPKFSNMPYGCLVRFWATGVTGNKLGSFVKLQFNVHWRYKK